MDNKELQSWVEAGKIAAESLEFSSSLIKEGEKLIDISSEIEKFIEKKGANLAFPVNLSLNNIAAHYTCIPNDETVLKAGDILKVDIGVEKEGCIGDTSKTFEVTTKKYQNLIKASEEARDNAIKLVKPGVELRELGKVIDETIKKYGFTPIKNLSGHGLAKYTIHTEPTIPNYDNGDKTKLKENQVIAIEPFASTGSGFIKEGKPSTIYRLASTRPIRDANARKLLIFIAEEYKTLPFSKRNLFAKFPNCLVSLSLLEKNGNIQQYTMLPEEKDNAIITQSEHTILVKETPVILTKL